MNRRDWLRNAGLIAAGCIAEDQIELVSRLGWARRFFPSADTRERASFYVVKVGRPPEYVHVRISTLKQAVYEPPESQAVHGVYRRGVFQSFQPIHLTSIDTLTVTFE